MSLQAPDELDQFVKDAVQLAAKYGEDKVLQALDEARLSMNSRSRDSEFDGTLQPVLAFYTAQLQSHAATGVALSIGFFALLQAWSGFKTSGLGYSLVFSFLATLLSYLGALTFLRLFAYGQLSQSILIGNFTDFTNSRKEYRLKPDSNWETILPYTKVSIYSNYFFRNHWLSKKHFRVILGYWMFNEKAQPRRSLLLFIAMITFLISILFLFNDPSVSGLIWRIVTSAILSLPAV